MIQTSWMFYRKFYEEFTFQTNYQFDCLVILICYNDLHSLNQWKITIFCPQDEYSRIYKRDIEVRKVNAWLFSILMLQEHSKWSKQVLNTSFHQLILCSDIDLFRFPESLLFPENIPINVEVFLYEIYFIFG
jgi:hypothetical protein